MYFTLIIKNPGDEPFRIFKALYCLYCLQAVSLTLCYDYFIYDFFVLRTLKLPLPVGSLHLSSFHMPVNAVFCFQFGGRCHGTSLIRHLVCQIGLSGCSGFIDDLADLTAALTVHEAMGNVRI